MTVKTCLGSSTVAVDDLLFLLETNSLLMIVVLEKRIQKHSNPRNVDQTVYDVVPGLKIFGGIFKSLPHFKYHFHRSVFYYNFICIYSRIKDLDTFSKCP